MPRPLEPNERYLVVLEGDRDKTPAPGFWVRALSMREWRQMRAEIDAARGWDQLEKGMALVERVVVGWEHMADPQTGHPLEFAAEKLDQVLDPVEVFELVNCLAFSARDKKKQE